MYIFRSLRIRSHILWEDQTGFAGCMHIVCAWGGGHVQSMTDQFLPMPGLPQLGCLGFHPPRTQTEWWWHRASGMMLQGEMQREKPQLHILMQCGCFNDANSSAFKYPGQWVMRCKVKYAYTLQRTGSILRSTYAPCFHLPKFCMAASLTVLSMSKTSFIARRPMA